MTAPDFRVVIPARHASTRLPGKPLLEVAGRPLIAWTLDCARASSATEILVATDDGRIADCCADLGVEAVMTRPDHPSGTDRIAEVVEARGWPDEAIIVNLQGDEPCMPAEAIDGVARSLAEDADAEMATLAVESVSLETLRDPNVVKVVTDSEQRALYFSRAPIPWWRDAFAQNTRCLPEGASFLRHVGLYAYRAGFVRRYPQLSISPLEQIESLEQLRVLWNGGRIRVALARQAPGPGVDTPEDLAALSGYLG